MPEFLEGEIYLLARQRPLFPLEPCYRSPFELLVERQRCAVIDKPIGQERERQLFGTAATVAPAESVGTVET